MLIIYLHDACLDNYRNLSDAKMDDLKSNYTLVNFKQNFLFQKAKKKKINNLFSLLLESSILQEEYEKTQELTQSSGELELFDI